MRIANIVVMSGGGRKRRATWKSCSKGISHTRFSDNMYDISFKIWYLEFGAFV
jgi:hypothetical protein